MSYSLPNVTTSDDWTSAATLSCPEARAVHVIILNAAVVVQAGHGVPAALFEPEEFLPPGGYVLNRQIDVLRIRSAVAGKAAQVSATATTEEDGTGPDAVGPLSSQTIDAQGNVVSDVSVATPIGTVVAYAGAAAPNGWLLCDGAAVARDAYPALYNVIGTTYGPGDGTTTFNLPDLRGRVAVGRGTHAEVDQLNDNDGLPVASRKPKHRHGKGSLNIPTGGSHTHTSRRGSTLGGANAHMSSTVDFNDGNVLAAATHAHPSSEFAGEVGDTTGPLDSPAYIVLHHIIRAT